MSKKNLLEKLNVSEISLVHKDSRPANQYATVLLSKVFETAQGAKEKFLELLKVHKLSKDDVNQILKEEDMTLEELKKAFDDLKKNFQGLETSKEVSDKIIKLSVQITKAESVEVLKTVQAEVAKLDQADPRTSILKEQVEEALTKASNSGKAEHFKQTKLPKEQHDAFDNLSPDDQNQYMKEHQKVEAGTSDMSDEDLSDEEDDSDSDVTKLLKKVFKTKVSKVLVVKKENRELISKLETLNAKVAKMEQEEEISKLVDSPELKDLKGIAKVEDIAKALLSVKKTDEGAYKELAHLIKTLSVQVKTAGLFNEFGKVGQLGDAQTRLDNFAAEIAKKDGTTKEDAYEKAMTQNPELYAQAEAERKSLAARQS